MVISIFDCCSAKTTGELFDDNTLKSKYINLLKDNLR